MHRGNWRGVTLLLVVSSLALSGVAVGGSNEPPLAEAGLDQQVAAGETVRLDATGSWDPDGNVTGYAWSIETPGGGTITPECGTCGTTSFRPETPGQYNVTVTVTDDDGATRTDTLYVDVDPAPGPSVSLSGPAEPIVQQSSGGPSGQATYVANVSRGGHPIDYVEWRVDGEQTLQRSVNDSGVTSVDYVHSIESAANHTLTVRVVDTAGREATDSMTVSPQVRTVGDGSDSGDDGYDGVMQVEWAGRYILIEAPTIEPGTGDIVPQSNPTTQELMNVATADLGEKVKTDFTGNDDENENRDSVNDEPDNTLDRLVDDTLPEQSDSSNDKSKSDDSSSTNSLIEKFCPICSKTGKAW